MKKLKVISLLLVMFMFVGVLAGCGGNGGEEVPANEDPVVEDPAETPEDSEPAEGTETGDNPWEGKRVGVAHITLYDEWCTEVKNELEKQGAEAGFAEINVQDGNLNAETQQRQVEDFITKQYDAVVVDPVSSDGIVPTLESVGDAGIPVFIFDSPASYDDKVTYIAWDHAMTGELAARWVAGYAKENLDGKIKVGVLALLNADHTRVRSERFVEVLEQELGKENIEYVFNQDFGETRESAANIVNNNIMKPIDVIWSAVDNGAMGAVSALETNNVEGTIVVSSGLNGVEPLNMINEGGYYKMGVGAPYSPRQISELIIQALKDYFSGKEVEPEQYVEFLPIDETNIGDYAEFLE